MSEYSPKRRTALVLAGSGTSGAYHAGVLRALEESGVKIDLVVGSGVGTVAAAYAAVAGSSKLLGDGGFWRGIRWSSFYRVRPLVQLASLLLACSLAVFMLPFALAAMLGLLLPIVMAAEAVTSFQPDRWLVSLSAAPRLFREPYLALFSAPVFALCVLTLGALARLVLTDRRRLAESFETVIDSRRGRERLARGLWSIARGAALRLTPPSVAELGKKYVALAEENFGEPGFRELILRTADLETGEPLCFTLLSDDARKSYSQARSLARAGETGEERGNVDLRGPDNARLLFPAVATALQPPLVTQPLRVTFPRQGRLSGETHRLGDATLVGGCGIAEARAAGAEQIIVASPVPERPTPPTSRRGVGALVGSSLRALERRAFMEIEVADRLNRIVATVGHSLADGTKGWQDPATAEEHRQISIYVVRPERRTLGPLELDGARDPSTEVEQTVDDLVDQGYRDTLRLFIGPVVGGSPEPAREEVAVEEPRAIEL